MFTIPDAIFAESFLSFIGLGIQIPKDSLGSLISDGTKYMQFHPYLLWFPTAILCPIMDQLHPVRRRPARRPRPKNAEMIIVQR